MITNSVGAFVLNAHFDWTSCTIHSHLKRDRWSANVSTTFALTLG